MEDKKNPFAQEAREEQKEAQNEAQADDDLIVSQGQINVPEENAQEGQQEETEPDQDEKYEALNNKYIRLAADFDNFRKRTETEKEELSKYTTVEILRKIASALDNFDRAQEHLKDVDNPETIKEGWQVAHKQLLDVLGKIGLVEIEALNQPFNPSEHEAITQVETEEFEPDTVALVAQKGYKYQDKVVRPALVGVAKKP